MLTELITLPLRVGVRVTRLWVRGAEQAFGLAQQAVESTGVIPGGRRASQPAPDSTQPGREPSWADAPSSPDEPAAAPSVSAAPQPAPRYEPEPEPAHVSEEPTLVAEVAEAGADEGAGAQVNVAEPWPGYRRMNARDVLSRLDTASPAELAAIQLYERAHRARQTVLSQAERRLRSNSGVGSRT
jgi:hypothetical protein